MKWIFTLIEMEHQWVLSYLENAEKFYSIKSFPMCKFWHHLISSCKMYKLYHVMRNRVLRELGKFVGSVPIRLYFLKSDCLLLLFHRVAVQESHKLLKILFKVNILIYTEGLPKNARLPTYKTTFWTRSQW